MCTWNGWPSSGGQTISVCNQPPRPTQPATFSGMRKEWRPNYSDARQLAVQASMVHGSCPFLKHVHTILTYITVPRTHTHTHTHTHKLFLGPPGWELVSEENFWTLWCKGILTEADTQTIRLGATPSGLSSAHRNHPIFYRPDALPASQPTVSKHWRQLAHSD